MSNYLKLHISSIMESLFLCIAALCFGLLIGISTTTILTSFIEVNLLIKTIMLISIALIMFVTFYYAFQ
jgi:ABC-type uncharacterized transport system permease subunit